MKQTIRNQKSRMKLVSNCPTSFPAETMANKSEVDLFWVNLKYSVSTKLSPRMKKIGMKNSIIFNHLMGKLVCHLMGIKLNTIKGSKRRDTVTISNQQPMNQSLNVKCEKESLFAM